jgi:hypothetical protein
MLNYNHIAADGKTIDPLIISPSIEIDFSQDIFLTTYAQYNTNINNFNINTKFEWRFRPMSDFFLVYTSNYVTTVYKNTGYNFTMKLVYWLN